MGLHLELPQTVHQAGTNPAVVAVFARALTTFSQLFIIHMLVVVVLGARCGESRSPVLSPGSKWLYSVSVPTGTGYRDWPIWLWTS